MNMNEIIILFNGYSHPDPENLLILKANCSCVLIKNDAYKIIVDTMTAWDGDAIIAELEKHEVTPDDIDFVISTHGHSDHVGNNNLFLNAKHIVGTSISHRTEYFLHDFDKGPYQIGDNILVLKTAGHTLVCVSVIVADCVIYGYDNQVIGSVIAITGDLFENEDDIFDEDIWLGAGSENPELQRRNRSKIADLVHYIIPGHGQIFPLTDEIRNTLRNEALGYTDQACQTDDKFNINMSPTKSPLADLTLDELSLNSSLTDTDTE